MPKTDFKARGAVRCDFTMDKKVYKNFFKTHKPRYLFGMP